MQRLTQTIMLLAVTCVLPAYSQSTPVLRADIPFAFRVGDKMLEAGTYKLQKMDPGIVTLIRSEDGSGAALTITAPLEAPQASEPRLVFHRYGNNYFLSQIWEGPGGGQLPMSPTERRILAEDRSLEKIDLVLAE